MFQWLRPKQTLDETDISTGLRMLLIDGVCGQAMMMLTTGAFLIAFALLLGASNTVIGLLSAVGPVAQVLQIPTIALVERTRHRKALVVFACIFNRGLFLFIAALPWFVPQQYRVSILLMALLIHFGLGNVAGCAYNSWIRDLIPEQSMSTFFARRMALATAAGAALSLLGGAAVDFYKNAVGSEIGAYTILFSVGSLAGLTGIFFLARMAEPLMPTEPYLGIWPLIAQPFRDGKFRPLLVYLGSWSFAVNFVAPFFAVYMIKRLGLSMTWILGLSVLSQLVNVLFFGVWGRLADRFSNKSALAVATPLFFITYLIWPFTGMPHLAFLMFPLLILIHTLAGVSTAGVALCATNLALKSAPYGKATSYLAVNALISGLAASLSPVLAGLAADLFDPYEIKVSLTWVNHLVDDVGTTLPTIDVRGLDFLYVTGFVFGMLAYSRVLPIKEEGEVSEAIVRQELVTEMRRMVRQASTVAGVRHLIYVPFAVFRYVKNRAAQTNLRFYM